MVISVLLVLVLKVNTAYVLPIAGAITALLVVAIAKAIKKK